MRTIPEKYDTVSEDQTTYEAAILRGGPISGLEVYFKENMEYYQ